MNRWLLSIALLLTLGGYFGPWVNHPVAGLVITGLDLGEYVKFLPVVRDGTVVLWRPGFYAPLVAASAAALLAAYRDDFGYRVWVRYPLLAIALIAAFNLVPPAWTPTRLLEPEFRWQTTSLILLLASIAVSPFLALPPRPIAATVVTTLAVVAIIAPLHGFFQILPAVSELYRQPLNAAWGPWCMTIGLILLAVAYWLPHSRQKEKDNASWRNEQSPATTA
jgi:hypothetical protein